MAANQQWTDFLSLVSLDAARTDWLGQHARALQKALADYTQARFGSDQAVVYLVDIVNDPAVISSVVASLTHVAEDDAAVKSAVAAVVGT